MNLAIVSFIFSDVQFCKGLSFLLYVGFDKLAFILGDNTLIWGQGAKVYKSLKCQT